MINISKKILLLIIFAFVSLTANEVDAVITSYSIHYTKLYDIDSKKLHSRNTVTPFDGWKVKGMPVYAVVRGNIVMKDGEIVGKPKGKHIKAIV